jgi:hypothetical protein
MKVEFFLAFHFKTYGKIEGSIKSWSNIYDAQLIIIKIIGLTLLSWQHLLTSTWCICQHNKHLVLISKVNKIINLEAQDWAVVNGHLNSTCI